MIALFGYAMLVLGLLVALYGELRFLAIAYRRSLWWLLGCMFIPFADWVFLFVNPRIAARPFGLSLVGLVLIGVGCWMSGTVVPID